MHDQNQTNKRKNTNKQTNIQNTNKRFRIQRTFDRENVVALKKAVKN